MHWLNFHNVHEIENQWAQVDRKVLVLYNPNARAGRSKKNALKATERLKEEKIPFSFMETRSIEEAEKSIASAKEDGATEVLAVGGDGTMHHIANFAIKYGLQMAMIPSGSGNDFASALNIPAKVEQAIEIFVQGKTASINAIRVNLEDRRYYSINVTDVGWGAKVVKSSQTKLKWLPGLMKYYLLAISEFVKYKPRELVVTIDGKEYRFQSRILAAGLGQTFGSGMRILPEARFNLDQINIAVLHGASKLQALKALTLVPKAKHVGLDYIWMGWGKKIKVEAEIPTLVESEGELKGITPLTMEVEKDVLKVVVPRNFSFDKPTLYAQ